MLTAIRAVLHKSVISVLPLQPKMAATTGVYFLSLAILLSLSTLSLSSDPDCVYSVYVRTGSILKGGTDSVISLTLYAADGAGILIKDLEKWGGLMGQVYDYFERGNLDIFSGRGPCLSGPICKMNLTSDGSGSHHGWYCNYVEVTTAAVHGRCNQQQFTVEQWLSRDTSPYQLSTVRNYCYDENGYLVKLGSSDSLHVV